MQFIEHRLLATFGLPTSREHFYHALVSDGLQIRDWVTFDRIRNLRILSDLTKSEWLSFRSIKDNRATPLEQLLLKDLRKHVRRKMERLNEREMKILLCRYGFGCEEMTIKEIGAAYGLTRERIRQIQGRAEEKLKAYLTSSVLDCTSDVKLDSATGRDEQRKVRPTASILGAG